MKASITNKKSEPRPPFLFRKQIEDLNQCLALVLAEEDSTLKKQFLEEVKKKLNKLRYLRGGILCAFLILIYEPLFIVTIRFANSNAKAFLSFFTLSLYLIYTIFLLRNIYFFQQLTERVIEAANVIILPDLISNFPAQYEQEYKFGIGLPGDMNRVVILLRSPRAKEVLTQPMKEKLLGYCRSVDQYPRMDSDNKRWATEIRTALEKMNPISEQPVTSLP